MANKSLDIIVLGATGLTGKCTVNHLAWLTKEKYWDVAWGITGRSKDKLQSLITELNATGKQTAKIMDNPVNILQKGIEFLTKAVEEDKNQNYEEALRFYVQGVMYFLHVAKYNAESQQAKDRIKEKCADYIDRVKKIKAYHNQIHGVRLIDNLETLSDSNVLNMVTEIICMCGDFMELKQPECENCEK